MNNPMQTLSMTALPAALLLLMISATALAQPCGRLGETYLVHNGFWGEPIDWEDVQQDMLHPSQEQCLIEDGFLIVREELEKYLIAEFSLSPDIRVGGSRCLTKTQFLWSCEEFDQIIEQQNKSMKKRTLNRKILKKFLLNK